MGIHTIKIDKHFVFHSSLDYIYLEYIPALTINIIK